MSSQNLTTDQTNIRGLVEMIISRGLKALGGKSKCIASFAIMRNFPGVESDLKRGCYFFTRTFHFNDKEYLFVPNVDLFIMFSESAAHNADEIIYVTLMPTLSIERYILHPRKTLRKIKGRQYLKYGEANIEAFKDHLKDGQLVFQFDYRLFRMPLAVYADSVGIIDEKVSKRKAESISYNENFVPMLLGSIYGGFGGRHNMVTRAQLFGKMYELKYSPNSK